ncbi:hypothetical protein IJH74_01195 [Candidatus Saccharibacteria bacterium]|nr:hypothetical protein [Candidatus Saccharibacteria bacterium]
MKKMETEKITTFCATEQEVIQMVINNDIASLGQLVEAKESRPFTYVNTQCAYHMLMAAGMNKNLSEETMLIITEVCYSSINLYALIVRLFLSLGIETGTKYKKIPNSVQEELMEGSMTELVTGTWVETCPEKELLLTMNFIREETEAVHRELCGWMIKRLVKKPLKKLDRRGLAVILAMSIEVDTTLDALMNKADTAAGGEQLDALVQDFSDILSEKARFKRKVEGYRKAHRVADDSMEARAIDNVLKSFL